LIDYYLLITLSFICFIYTVLFIAQNIVCPLAICLYGSFDHFNAF
jgi:hypothetical protein